MRKIIDIIGKILILIGATGLYLLSWFVVWVLVFNENMPITGITLGFALIFVTGIFIRLRCDNY